MENAGLWSCNSHGAVPIVAIIADSMAFGGHGGIAIP
jgi:hypothetical protein